MEQTKTNMDNRQPRPIIKEYEDMLLEINFALMKSKEGKEHLIKELDHQINIIKLTQKQKDLIDTIKYIEYNEDGEIMKMFGSTNARNFKKWKK